MTTSFRGRTSPEGSDTIDYTTVVGGKEVVGTGTTEPVRDFIV